MHQFVETKLPEIAALCERYGVRRLDLFGSATLGDRTPKDIDLLVEFRDLSPGTYADTYFGLLEKLTELFGRPVDLVVSAAIRNRFFRAAVDKSRVSLYGA